MTYQIAPFTVALLSHDRQVLAAVPVRPVPAPGCVLWNTAIELRRRRGIAR